MGDRPPEDAELVGRARRGDASAYEELVRRHQGAAVRVAYPLVGAPGEAEDAVQEAFVKAYRALPRFREESAFRPWLMRIVANEALNRRRAFGRRGRLAMREARDPASGAAVPSPEAEVLAEERRRAVVAAMERLRDDDRLVLAYRWFLEMSEAEMAQALGVARGTVKSRLSRAMERLRSELPEEDE